MNNRTIRFLKSRFQQYYKTAEISLPDHLPNREWAFILFDDMPEKMMRRHKSFGSPGEALDYLYGMAPAHVYNSTAYYEYPNAKKMNEKNWLGAELIFDLDADHLPNAPRNYADMLENVKKEAIKLMDFLLDDFGFSEYDMELVFSGGRGYHFHITNPKVLTLGSPERREIINYISGKDLDYEKFFVEEEISGEYGAGSKSKWGGRKPTRWVLKGYDSGWGKRIARYTVDYLKREVQKEFKKDMFKELQEKMREEGDKIGQTSINNLIKVASSEKALNDILNNGRLDFNVKKSGEVLKYFVTQSSVEYGINFGASVDEPVTADIKRLIRVPGSLHGGSGMQVKKLAFSELEDFEPLRDTVVFGEEPVKVNVSKPFTVQLKGKDLRIEEGIQEVPEYAAVYLMCRGVAEYGHRRDQPNPV